MRTVFRTWLASNYSGNTTASHFSCAKRVEEKYGDLDAHYDEDRLETVITALNYSKADQRAGKSNPTLLVINGDPYNVLASFKSAITTYRRFRDEGGEEEVLHQEMAELAGEAVKQKKEGNLFGLEKQMQAALRMEIDQLETGLKIIDGGTEKSVNSGSIDILAEDQSGAIVVIELKAGMAKREAIGQITGYMGDMVVEEPGTSVRGILVAADFDKSSRAAARVIPTLRLTSYRMHFDFGSPE